MLKNPKIQELVQNRHDNRVGKIIEVNIKWGWFVVQFHDSYKKRYALSSKGNQTLRKLNQDEYADYLLRLERRGITDYWRD